MGENPVKMAMRIVIALVLVYAIKPFLTLIYAGSTTVTMGGANNGLFGIIFDHIKGLGGGDYSYDYESALGGLDGKLIAFMTGGFSSIAAGIVAIVLLGTICINFIKLALEMVERYILLNLLIFFSPMAASAITLESTIKVFSSYIKMFFGQLLMILMNLISIKLVLSGMSFVSDAFGSSAPSIAGVSDAFLPYFGMILVIAMMKVLQRLDNYARDIGLTVGITGGRLTDELLAAGGTIGAMAGAVFGKGGKSGKAGGAAGTAVAGASLLSKVGLTGGPVGMAAKYVGAAAKAFGTATFAKQQIGDGTSNKSWSQRFNDAFKGYSGVGNETKASIVGGLLGYSIPRGGGLPLSVNKLNNTLGNTDINGNAAPFEGFTTAVRGAGGYVADDKNGDTWAVTTSRPNYGDYQVFQPVGSGETYYAQNLSKTAADYQASSGKLYGPLQDAIAQSQDGAAHDFSNLYINENKVDYPNTPEVGYPTASDSAPVSVPASDPVSVPSSAPESGVIPIPVAGGGDPVYYESGAPDVSMDNSAYVSNSGPEFSINQEGGTYNESTYAVDAGTTYEVPDVPEFTPENFGNEVPVSPRDIAPVQPETVPDGNVYIKESAVHVPIAQQAMNMKENISERLPKGESNRQRASKYDRKAKDSQ